jgi:AcrR family transcriptional regulator
MTEEIKREALAQLASEGSALSLRAVAREMGMVSSAIYRYFPSRDELLTALIIDAYNSLGDAAEFADRGVRRQNAYLTRWLETGHAIRSWALAHSAEYALIYGSPIPGYQAPEATITPANRAVFALARSVAEAEAAGQLREPAAATALAPTENGAFSAELRTAATALGFVGESRVAERFLGAVTHLFGALNFELFGRLNNVIDQRDEWYDRQLRALAVALALGTSR